MTTYDLFWEMNIYIIQILTESKPSVDRWDLAINRSKSTTSQQNVDFVLNSAQLIVFFLPIALTRPQRLRDK